MEITKSLLEGGSGKDLVCLDIFLQEVYRLTEIGDYRTLRALSIEPNLEFTKLMKQVRNEAVLICRQKEKKPIFLQEINNLLQEIKQIVIEKQPCPASY